MQLVSSFNAQSNGFQNASPSIKEADVAVREVTERSILGEASQHAQNDVIRQVTEDKVSIGDKPAKPSTYDSLDATAQKPELKKQEEQNSTENELEDSEESEVQELKARDTEVRLHEQAHAAVGGQYAGSPSYEYETGPDGRQYAVGGEVSIDVSEEENPEDTVSKMQVVRAAALAPAEPSTQDYKVAAEASQKEQAARAEVAKQSVSGENSGDENSGSGNGRGEAEPNKSVAINANVLATKAYQDVLNPVLQVFTSQA